MARREKLGGSRRWAFPLTIWRVLQLIFAVGGFSLLCVPLASQQPITFQYYYDDLNQSVEVVEPLGVVVQNAYDFAGNVAKILRSTVIIRQLTSLNISQLTAPDGGTIPIQDQGFTNPAQNIVTLGGASVISIDIGSIRASNWSTRLLTNHLTTWKFERPSKVNDRVPGVIPILTADSHCRQRQFRQ